MAVAVVAEGVARTTLALPPQSRKVYAMLWEQTSSTMAKSRPQTKCELLGRRSPNMPEPPMAKTLAMSYKTSLSSLFPNWLILLPYYNVTQLVRLSSELDKSIFKLLAESARLCCKQL
jgi:hypothetical protein